MMLSPRLDSLGVRPLAAEDAPALHALIVANRERLARWLPWAAEQTLADTETFVAASEGAIVGVVGFHEVDWVSRNTRIGYWLAAEAQGRGTMTTVVHALIEYAFFEWELHRVEIRAAPGNRRSRAIPERLGFREEGLLRETELVGGQYLDSVVYGALVGEWTRAAET
jgi:ribosomal-protein-serine acetyltransferase